ncbi:MAG: SMI1/KNR4 family protein [Candidatus Sericytochromatia bacterium]
MFEAWNKIEAWLSKNEPELFNSLLEGASDDEIKKTETILNISFPEDFISCYKKHNGFVKNKGFIWGWELCSLEEIEKEWKIWNDLEELKDLKSDPDKGIKDDWFNNKWIPFLSNGFGDFCCIDLDPAIDGNEGQVITLWHDNPSRTIEASNLKEFFDLFFDDLESNNYEITKYGLEKL